MRSSLDREPGYAAAQALRRHICVTVAVVLALLGGTLLAQLLAAQAEAERAASDVTRRVASTVLEVLREADFTHGVSERAELDTRLSPFFETGMIVRVKVWQVQEGGVIVVYSDDPRVEGDRRVFSKEFAESLEGGDILTFSVPNDSEHRHERDAGGELREGFIAFHDATGADMRLEVYVPVPTPQIMMNALTVSLPIAGFGILLLVLVLIPLSLTLGRRLRAVEEARLLAVDYGLDARADERLELARRLHDEVVQDLAGARLRLEAELAGPAHSAADPRMLESIVEMLGRDITVLRGILEEYTDTAVDADSLPLRLGELCEQSSKRTPTRAAISEVDGLEDDRAAVVLRAADELVRNAQVHSEAKRLELSWGIVDDDHAELVVSDDGRGFDPQHEQTPGHVGLALIEHVVLACGGKMGIDSAPGRGTRVTVRVPIGDS